MAETATTAAWVILFFGIYSLAAGLGELLTPGYWQRLIWEMEKSRAIQFLIGFIEIVLAAAIYLTNPWNPADILSVVVSVLAGLLLIEGVLFLMVPDKIMALARKMMGSDGSNQKWAFLSIALGMILIFVSLIQL